MRSNLSYTKYSSDSSHSDTFAIVMQLHPIISLHQLQVRRYFLAHICIYANVPLCVIRGSLYAMQPKCVQVHWCR